MDLHQQEQISIALLNMSVSKLRGGGESMCLWVHEYTMCEYVGVWFDIHWKVEE